MKRTTEELLEIELAKIEATKNRIKELKKRASKEERNKRTKRLIEIGATAEAVFGKIEKNDLNAFRAFCERHKHDLKLTTATPEANKKQFEEPIINTGEEEEFYNNQGIRTDKEGLYLYDIEGTPWFQRDGKWHARGRDPQEFNKIQWDRKPTN